ncbi:hypothetical protein EJ05DRAFT_498749 [Pseudovirgaria hyperparasitica]|uniref:Uncharacterized protein n=1 Tax=Pseudovirgaria hyperparasitica TaxID=470096 RepID=A0A6A6WEK0_9PEZI|nr:uncharacterized protein EJ05DRAFT_498749 [Pseudovirgaria hyperparasitica]KAF2759541.1 hypothetical protein EJ05DRAFT_498749 [Pseudovirgaria hyperparasitica]
MALLLLYGWHQEKPSEDGYGSQSCQGRACACKRASVQSRDAPSYGSVYDCGQAVWITVKLTAPVGERTASLYGGYTTIKAQSRTRTDVLIGTTSPIHGTSHDSPLGGLVRPSGKATESLSSNGGLPYFEVLLLHEYRNYGPWHTYGRWTQVALRYPNGLSHVWQYGQWLRFQGRQKAQRLRNVCLCHLVVRMGMVSGKRLRMTDVSIFIRLLYIQVSMHEAPGTTYRSRGSSVGYMLRHGTPEGREHTIFRLRQRVLQSKQTTEDIWLLAIGSEDTVWTSTLHPGRARIKASKDRRMAELTGSKPCMAESMARAIQRLGTGVTAHTQSDEPAEQMSHPTRRTESERLRCALTPLA